MIGIFYVSVATIADDTGHAPDDIRAALRHIEQAGYAFYDYEIGLVWIPNHAQFDIGDKMAPGDKRRKKLMAELSQAAGHRFEAEFRTIYGEAYGLTPAAPASRPANIARTDADEGACKVANPTLHGASEVGEPTLDGACKVGSGPNPTLHGASEVGSEPRMGHSGFDADREPIRIRSGSGSDPDPGRARAHARPGFDGPGSGPGHSRYEDQFWRAAYAEAVREATGKPFGFPDKQISGLRRAVEAHCTEPACADAWIRQTVPKFVSATRAKPGPWGAFGPDGFLRWLNAECPSEERVSPGGGAKRGAEITKQPYDENAPWMGVGT